MDDIIISQCKLPNCKDLEIPGLGICEECIRATVLRFMHIERSRDLGSTEPITTYQKNRAIFWFQFVVENLDDLVAKEKRTIERLGPDYDRNSHHPHLRVVMEDEEDK